MDLIVNMIKRKKNNHPDRLNEEKVMERWREAMKSAPSLISSIFKDGQIKEMPYRELYDKLKETGIDYDDAEDVISEAGRRKLIYYDSKTQSYHWIPVEKRDEEMHKTELLEKAIEDVFVETNAKWLHRDELIKSLADKGLSREDIERAVHEATRDCIVDLHESDGILRLIPRKERTRMRELNRLRRLYSKKQLYESITREHVLGLKS